MAEEFDVNSYVLSLADDDEQKEDEVSPVAIPSPVQEEEEFDVNSYVLSLAEEPEVEAAEVVSSLLPPPKKDPASFDTEEAAIVDEQVTFGELASDTDYMDMLSEYSVSRFGEEGAQQAGESKEDYLKRFLTHTREFGFNSIDLGRQLDWIRTANEEERIKFGYLYSQLESLPSFYEEGGTGYASAIRDFGKSLVLDPLNYIGFGAGKVASVVASRAIIAAFKKGGKKLALEEAAKLSAKRMLTTRAGRIAAGGIAVESGAAGVQDLKLQELERLSQKYGEDTPEDKDYLRAGLTSTLGLGLGALGVKLSGGLQGGKLVNAAEARIKQAEIGKELLDARNADIAGKAAADRSAEATSETATGIFDVTSGREALSQLGEIDEGASEIAQMQFKTDLMKRVGNVVTNIVQDLADNGRLGEMVDTDTKASEVIGKIVSDSLKKTEGKSAKDVAQQTEEMLTGKDGILSAIDELDVDGDVLESAISRAGLTNKQFVDAFGASFTDAGAYLNTASRVGKIMKGIKEVDPTLYKEVIGDTDADAVIGPLGKAHAFMQRIDRERRALMVTQVATTIRNIATAGTRLTMDIAADAMESSLYQIGRGADAAMTGNTPVGFKGSIKNVIRDSFGRLDRMRNTVGTAELSEALLRHNPRLAERMDRSLQEIGSDQSLSRATRTLNGLNVAQDLFFRRAIFTDVIDKRLRRAGVIVDNPTKVGQFKSLEEFSLSGKVLPSEVIAEAVDDSLSFTFSRMPKAGGKEAGDTVGHYFIKFNEAIGPVPGPVGTGAFPFSRFMVNALQFQFKYMPTNIVSSAYTYGMAKQTARLAKASKAAGNIDLATKQGKQAAAALNKARSDFSKGIVGTAALMSAVNYRAKNQDVKFFESKNDDGSTSDLRPFFPLVPYLALADLIVKMGGTEVSTLGMVDQPETVQAVDLKEILEGFTGVQVRTGASSYILENAVELFKTDSSDITSQRLSEMMGGYLGELFGGGATPLRVVRDVQAAFDTEAAVVRDAKQTEGVSSSDRFVSALKNTIIKDLPGLAKELPAFESPTREGDIYRQSPLIGQLTGLRKEAKRNPIEAELVRFGIKNWTVAPYSGDKTVDALVKRSLGPIVDRELSELVTSELYLNKSKLQQRAMLNARLKNIRGQAKAIANIEAFNDKSKSYTPFDRAAYSKLTSLQTDFAEEYYMNTYGYSPIEMQEREPDKNHLKKAVAIGKQKSKQVN